MAPLSGPWPLNEVAKCFVGGFSCKFFWLKVNTGSGVSDESSSSSSKKAAAVRLRCAEVCMAGGISRGEPLAGLSQISMESLPLLSDLKSLKLTT